MTESRTLVWRYYLYQVTNSAGFYLPVAVIFLTDRGFGLGFVGLAYAVYGFAQLGAEIPTGYLGDWLGRRESLALGAAIRAVVLGAYPFLEGAGAYLALHVLWAVGRTFRTGTRDAWLYELLAARFDEAEYARVEGRGSTALLVTSAVGAILGGLLYGVDPAYPFVVNAALALAGLPVLWSFPAVGDDCDPADADCEVFGLRDAVTALRLQAGRPAVRWLVVYAALFQALFLVTRIYEQPALDAVGVPVAGFGVLYAAFKLVSAGAAASAGWLHDHLGTRGVFLALVPVYALAYAGILVVPALVVPALFVNRGRRAVTRPVRNQYLNDRLEDVGRATVLSGASMVLALVGATARLVAGAGTEAVGVLPFLAAAGVVVPVAALALWVATSPVRAADGAAAGNTEGAAAAD